MAILNGSQGKEVTIQGTDGVFTRMRAFLVGRRMYAIYASAADKVVLISPSTASVPYDVRLFLGSLTLLGR